MNTLTRFRRKRILVVGDIVLDRFVYGDVSKVSPEAPVPVVNVEKEIYKAGGAGNVAANITSLGASAVLCGTVGDDFFGNLALKKFRQAGIDTSCIKKTARRPTTIKTRIIARNQQVVRVDREKISDVSSKTIIPLIEKTITTADAVIVSDYGKGIISAGLLEYLIPKALETGKIITVDPKAAHFSRYTAVTSLTPNHFEAAEAAGMKTETDAEIKKAGIKLLKMLQAESLVITRGEKGMTVFAKNRILNIPTQARDIFDVTGAGDTVIAVLTCALSAGFDTFKSAALANSAAGIVVGKFGTASVSEKELLNAYNRRNSR